MRTHLLADYCFPSNSGPKVTGAIYGILLNQRRPDSVEFE